MIQHVYVQVYPIALFRLSSQRFTNAFYNSRRTYSQGFEDIDTINVRAIYIGPGKVVVAVFALTQLDDISVGNKRTGNAWPFGYQLLTTTSCQRQVHACYRA